MVRYISQIRHVSGNFSLTWSTIGQKINKQVVEPKILDAINTKLKLEYTNKDHSNLDFRIFADEKDLIVAVKIFQKSLCQRTYKEYSRIGSLKSTIAAAMVNLVLEDNLQGKKLLDPFCGSGTILCEAILLGNEISGSDISPEAVDFTIKNLHNCKAGTKYSIKVSNASKMLEKSNNHDLIVSNLPWDS